MSGRPREGAAGDLNTVRVSRVVGLLCGRPREGAAGDLNVVIDAPRVFVVVAVLVRGRPVISTALRDPYRDARRCGRPREGAAGDLNLGLVDPIPMLNLVAVLVRGRPVISTWGRASSTAADPWPSS